MRVVARAPLLRRSGTLAPVLCSTGVSSKGPPGRRDRILRRDRFRCVYCGEPFLPEDLTLDHVEPRMRGGDDSEGNLVACCRGCNRLKGGLPAWAFLAGRPELRANFKAAVAASDTRHARAVWDRLLRAIDQAAAAQSL
jgi:5-methylcytosine-specific restriction endonuclease McrA